MIEGIAPAGFGPGAPSNGHGFGSGREAFSMMKDLQSTKGNISAVSQTAAKNALTFVQEFGWGDVFSTFTYQVKGTRWTNNGRTIESMNDPDEVGGDRIQRVLAAEKRMMSDPSIRQAVVASEDLKKGDNRHFLYVYTRDEQYPDTISALAFEFQGNENEFQSVLSNLSGKSIHSDKRSSVSFTKPLYFTSEQTLSVKDIHEAAYDSFGSSTRRGEMNSYLTRLTRDTHQFDELIQRRQKQERRLQEQIETMIKTNENVRAGLSGVARGILSLINETVQEEDRRRVDSPELRSIVELPLYHESITPIIHPDIGRGNVSSEVVEMSNVRTDIVLAAYHREQDEEADDDEKQQRIRIERPKITVKKTIDQGEKVEKENQKNDDEISLIVSPTESEGIDTIQPVMPAIIHLLKTTLTELGRDNTVMKNDVITAILPQSVNKSTNTKLVLPETMEVEEKQENEETIVQIMTPMVPAILGLNVQLIKQTDETVSQRLQSQQEDILIADTLEDATAIEQIRPDFTEFLYYLYLVADTSHTQETIADDSLISAVNVEIQEDSTATYRSRSDTTKQEEKQLMVKSAEVIVTLLIPIILGLNNQLLDLFDETVAVRVIPDQGNKRSDPATSVKTDDMIVTPTQKEDETHSDRKDTSVLWKEILGRIYQHSAQKSHLQESNFTQSELQPIQHNVQIWEEVAVKSHQILELFTPSRDPIDIISDETKIDTVDLLKQEKQEYIREFQETVISVLKIPMAEDIDQESAVRIQAEAETVVTEVYALTAWMSTPLEKRETHDEKEFQPEVSTSAGETIQRLSLYLSLYEDEKTSREMKLILPALMQKELEVLMPDKLGEQKPDIRDSVEEANNTESETILTHTLIQFVERIEEVFFKEYGMQIELDIHNPLFCEALFFALCLLITARKQVGDTLSISLETDKLKEAKWEKSPNDRYGFLMERIQTDTYYPSYILPILSHGIIYQWLAADACL